MEKPRAVIIDDDDLFCILFARIFKSNGIQATFYHQADLYLCGRPDIESCPVEEACCDFLLTDNILPEMSGIEFLEKTRRLGCKIPEQRKAIISGHWTQEELEEARQVVDRVFDKSEAKQKIAEWVGTVA